jgi:hypothetical protein
MIRLSKGVVRPLVAVSLAAALVACGQQDRPSTGAGARGHYSRPASYDPPGPPGDPWGPWIREASRRFDVPETWIREVMRQESGGRASATSHAGAMGLMQVMPATYRELRARYGLGDDPYHPYDSIMAGTAYIREMYELYGSPAFLAAYNAGPRRLEDYLWGGRGLPGETRNYIARIGPRIAHASPTRRAPPEVYAAAEIPLSIPPGPRRMDQATMLALREQRDRVDPGVQVAQLPPGRVVRMEPIPDGSTYAAAAESEPVPAPEWVASADPGAGVAAAPRSVGGGGGTVVRMEPIPDGSTPEGAARLAEANARAQAGSGSGGADAPTAAPLRGAAPSLLASANAAALPAAPQRRGAPAAQPAARSQLAMAAPGRTASPPPSVSRGFSLIPSAQAAALPQGGGGGAAAASRGVQAAGGGWGVQVGAFASVNLARAAATNARDSVQTLGARTLVQPVAQGRTTLYRARVVGLSRDAANSACDRLRARGCIVLSPSSI